MRAAVLLDADGRLVAHAGAGEGEADRFGELARELVKAADQAAERREIHAWQVEVSTPRGAVFAIREAAPEAGSARTLAVVARRFALPALMFMDMRHVLAAVDPEGG